jgi:hypothetical protein
VTKLKIGGLGAAASSAMEPHIGAIYAKPGRSVLAVVELEHVERTQPGPRSDKEASVTVRATQLEVPTIAQESVVRDVLRALYLQRTARGTLDEANGTVDLETETLRLTTAAGTLHAIDAAQMRAALRHFGDQARRARHNDKATEATLRADLQAIAKAIDAVLDGASQEEFALDGDA